MEQLRDLHKEIKAIDKQINLRKKLDNYQADVVKGSMAEFPYAETHFRIEGEYDSLSEQLKLAKQDLVDEIEELEYFLSGVKDAEIRTMLRYRYAVGLTYQEIGIETGYDASVVYRKIMKFWDEVEDET